MTEYSSNPVIRASQSSSVSTDVYPSSIFHTSADESAAAARVQAQSQSQQQPSHQTFYLGNAQTNYAERPREIGAGSQSFYLGNAKTDYRTAPQQINPAPHKIETFTQQQELQQQQQQPFRELTEFSNNAIAPKSFFESHNITPVQEQQYYAIEHGVAPGRFITELREFRPGESINSFWGNVPVKSNKMYREPFIGKAAEMGDIPFNVSDIKGAVNPTDIQLEQAASLLLFSPIVTSKYSFTLLPKKPVSTDVPDFAESVRQFNFGNQPGVPKGYANIPKPHFQLNEEPLSTITSFEWTIKNPTNFFQGSTPISKSPTSLSELEKKSQESGEVSFYRGGVKKTYSISDHPAQNQMLQTKQEQKLTTQEPDLVVQQKTTPVYAPKYKMDFQYVANLQKNPFKTQNSLFNLEYDFSKVYTFPVPFQAPVSTITPLLSLKEIQKNDIIQSNEFKFIPVLRTDEITQLKNIQAQNQVTSQIQTQNQIQKTLEQQIITQANRQIFDIPLPKLPKWGLETQRRKKPLKTKGKTSFFQTVRYSPIASPLATMQDIGKNMEKQMGFTNKRKKRGHR